MAKNESKMEKVLRENKGVTETELLQSVRDAVAARNSLNKGMEVMPGEIIQAEANVATAVQRYNDCSRYRAIWGYTQMTYPEALKHFAENECAPSVSVTDTNGTYEVKTGTDTRIYFWDVVSQCQGQSAEGLKAACRVFLYNTALKWARDNGDKAFTLSPEDSLKRDELGWTKTGRDALQDQFTELVQRWVDPDGGVKMVWKDVVFFRTASLPAVDKAGENGHYAQKNDKGLINLVFRCYRTRKNGANYEIRAKKEK